MDIEHFESVTICGLNRFELNQIIEINKLIKIATTNYELLNEITPLTLVGIKCIISNASFIDGEVNSYKCFGFESLDEQVKFTNKYCEVDMLKWFKNETTIDQIRSTITFLRNNLILQHIFENHTNNICEPFFLSVYASKFIVDRKQLSIELLDAAHNTEKFKELIEKGADPCIRSNDSFERNILHMATLVENLDLVKFIVNHRLVDINAVDSDDKTPLYYIFKRLKHHCDKDIIIANCFKKSDLRNLMEIADFILSKSGKIKRSYDMVNIANLISIYASNYQYIVNFSDELNGQYSKYFHY